MYFLESWGLTVDSLTPAAASSTAWFTGRTGEAEARLGHWAGGSGRGLSSRAPRGWGNRSLPLAGPPRGLDRGSCPELSVHGGGREAATRSTKHAVCQSLGPPARPAGSIQNPPLETLGEAARIRAAGCTLPSPSNRGLKWVKEEGGGPGGLGEGPRSAEGAQREGTRGECLKNPNHVCGELKGRRLTGQQRGWLLETWGCQNHLLINELQEAAGAGSDPQR